MTPNEDRDGKPHVPQNLRSGAQGIVAPRTSDFPYLALIIGSAIFAVLLTLLQTSRYGIGTTPDSAAYVYAARSLRSFHGYNAYGDAPLVDFPPFFSLVLAIVTVFGIDALQVARFLNAFCFGAIVLLCGYWFMWQVRSRLLAIGGIVGVVVSLPLSNVTSYAWSEPLFILLILVFFLCLGQFLAGGKHAMLVGTAIAAALASLTRYSGVTVTVTGVIVLLLLSKGAMRTRVLNAILYGVVAVFPLLLWLIRNEVRSATLFGERGASPYPLVDNLQLAFGISGYGVFSISGMPAFAYYVVVPLLLLGACSVAVLTHARDREIVRKAVFPVACFVTIYLLYLVASATAVAFDRIDIRLLSPIQIPVIVLMLQQSFMQGLFRSRWMKVASRAILVIIVTTAMTSNAISTLKYTQQTVTNGAGGFASTQYQSSALLATVRTLPRSTRLYSNVPHAIYLLTDANALEGPRKYAYNSLADTKAENSAEFIRYLNTATESYLVWFENEQVAYTWYLYSPDEMRQFVDLTLVTRTSDGSLYRITPKK